MTAVISNDIGQLDASFRAKFNARWAEVTAKYPNARVFEARRTQERQNYLYAQGRYEPYKNNKVVTRTLKSKHLEGKAVDIVFLNSAGQPTWNGPYDDLIDMAKKYGIANLKPRETCHFEDNGQPLNTPETEEPEVIRIKEQLIKNGIWNGEYGDGVTKRVILLVAKLFDKTKKE